MPGGRLLSGRPRPSASAREPAPSQSRSADDTELPEYEPPSCPMGQQARRQLQDLLSNNDAKKYGLSLEKSIAILGASVADINDRHAEREKALAGVRERAESRNQSTDEKPYVHTLEKAVRKMRSEVPELSEQCDHAVRAVIDMRVELEDGKTALHNAIEVTDQESVRVAEEIRQLEENEDDDDEDTKMTMPTITGPLRLLEEEKERLAIDYHSKSLHQRYAMNNDYTGFRKQWHDGTYGKKGKPLPDKAKWFKENGDADISPEDDDDDDLVVAEETLSMRCPLSGRIFEDPYTSRPCNHTFDKAAIDEYFIRGPTACPVAGCSAVLTGQDFDPDPVVLRRIKRAQAEQMQQDDDEDGDEDGDEDDLDEDGDNAMQDVKPVIRRKNRRAEEIVDDEDE